MEKEEYKMNNAEAIEYIRDVMCFLKTNHMLKDLDDEVSPEDRDLYKKQFKSLQMAISAFESVESLTVERDAAVAELEHFKKAFKSQVEGTRGVYHCDACKYGGDCWNRDDIGKKCPKGCDGYNKWEWGGVQE